jgi:hypothetical protein
MMAPMNTRPQMTALITAHLPLAVAWACLGWARCCWLVVLSVSRCRCVASHAVKRERGVCVASARLARASRGTPPHRGRYFQPGRGRIPPVSRSRGKLTDATNRFW